MCSAAWSMLQGVDLGPCNNAWTLIKIGPVPLLAIYHSFKSGTLSHSIALRSELVVLGYPGLSWTWGALALGCLVCAGLWRLRFGVPLSVLDMGLSDHRLSGQEDGVPGVVLDPRFTRLSLGGPGSVLDLE